MTFSRIDLAIVLGCAAALIAIATYVSHEPDGHARNSEDYMPGICANSILGVFRTGATVNGALLAALSSFGLSLAGKLLMPAILFMDRVLYVFIACCLVMSVVVPIERRPQPDAVELSDIDLSTSTGYWFGSAVVVAGLVSLNWAFW